MKSTIERENSKSKKALKELSDAVLLFLDWIDNEMRKPSDVTRGKRIAQACNSLDMINDGIRFNCLGVDFRKDDKRKVLEKLKEKRK